MLCRLHALLFCSMWLFVCLHLCCALPLLSGESPKAKRFWNAGTGDNFAPQAPPMLLPYASGNGFVSPFPAGLSDRWAGYLAEQQFMGGPNKRTPEDHFMEPGWNPLEPSRFEWNFNRLR